MFFLFIPSLGFKKTDYKSLGEAMQTLSDLCSDRLPVFQLGETSKLFP